MIKLNDQLSQDNWYLTLATNVLATYIIWWLFWSQLTPFYLVAKIDV